MRDGDSGWRRANFTGPGCERLGEPLDVVAAVDTGRRLPELEPGGWERAGYATAACEQFARA